MTAARDAGEEDDEVKAFLAEVVSEFETRAIENPTKDDVLAWTAQSALSMFEVRIERLIDAVGGHQQTRAQTPPSLLQSRKELDKRARKEVEALVRQHRQELEAMVRERSDELIEAHEEEISNIPDYPMPIEMTMALTPQFLGKRGEEVITDFIDSLSRQGADALNYGLNYKQWLDIQELPDPAIAALVPAAVSEFEQLLHSLLRVAALKHPKAMSIDSKQISVAEAVALKGNLLAIQLMIIDRSIKAYLRDSVFEWERQLDKWPGIAVIELTGSFAQFSEIFLRRNVIVHNGGRVDREYLDRLMPDIDAPPLGSLTVCDARYVLTALQMLRSVGKALGLLWMPAISKDASPDPSKANRLVFEALEEERWADACKLGSKFLDELRGSDAGDSPEMIRVNVWMARRESSGELESIRQEVEAWQPPDDDPRWPVARAALLQQPDAVATAITAAAKSGTPADVFSEWPLIKSLGRHPRLTRALASSSASGPQPAGRKRRRR